MGRFWVALVFAACSSAPPPAPAVTPPTPAPKPAAPVVSARGGACSPDGPTCGDGMLCGPLPGGYCLSFCGVTGDPCTDGVCVPTIRAGEMCLGKCSSDADCRKPYSCDAQWHACALPGIAAMMPHSCPTAGARDPAFAASEALTTASSPGVYQFEPTSVIANDGSVVSIYIGRGKMTAGNTLGIVRGHVDAPFGSSRQSHFDPWLAHDAKGGLHAVWLGFDGRSKHQEIGFASSTDGGATWSKPIAVNADGDCKDPDAKADDDDNGCLDKPMLAIGPDPANKTTELVHIMYAANAGLRVRTSRDGGRTFAAPVTPLEGIYGTAVVGRDGRLHVVTLNGGPGDGGDFGSDKQKVEYAASRDGGATFGKPVSVTQAGESVPFFFSNPAIAVDDKRGWIYIAYTRGGHDALWDIEVAASKDGATWTRTRIGDDPPCATHMVPNVAVDPTTGTLHVAWYDSHGEHGRFAHATCPAGAKSCKDAGAINDQPFAAFSTVRHASTWIGEYESLLVDDKRRVLHAVWSQPVDEAGKPISRIFHATAKLK